jgi:hypothetical protein
MTERDLAIKVRRLLLLAVDLLERFYHLGKHSEGIIIQEVAETDNTTFG